MSSIRTSSRMCGHWLKRGVHVVGWKVYVSGLASSNKNTYKINEKKVDGQFRGRIRYVGLGWIYRNIFVGNRLGDPQSQGRLFWVYFAATCEW